MAIIYTYPRLLNPTGEELIVVSDVNNQNATRLVSIADLCGCCGGGGGGCANVFKTVKAGGVLSTAVGCNDELEFTSSGGTVTITTPVDGVVNFEADGGGTCPTTYVLKPVTCSLGICTTNEIATNWAFTCSTALAPHVGSYVYLTNQGELVFNTGPSHGGSPGQTCWEVDIWDPIPTARTCGECCEDPSTIKFTSCDGAYTFYSDTISVGGASVGDVFNITNVNYPGITCWTYQGAEPGTAEAATLFGAYGSSDCVCCTSDFRAYTPCDGGDEIIIDATAWASVDDFTPDDCIQYKILVDDGWACATFVECVADGPATALYDVEASAFSPCCSTPACIGSPYDYTPCAGNPVGFTTTLVAPGLPGAAIVGDVISVSSGGPDAACYTISSSTDPVTDVTPTATAIYSSPDNTCTCCQNTIRMYTDCDGSGANYYLDFDGTALDPANPPSCLKVEDNTSGIYFCATYVDCTQGPALGDVTLTVPAAGNCCTAAPECEEQILYDWRLCQAAWDAGLGDSGFVPASGLPTLAGVTVTPAATEEGSVYTYLDPITGNVVCVNIRVRNSYTPEPATYAPVPSNAGTVYGTVEYTGLEGETDCMCCEGTYRYDRCVTECPTPGVLPPNVWISPNRMADPMIPTSMIWLQDTATSDVCCYEIVNGVDVCERDTTTRTDTSLWPQPETFNPATQTFAEQPGAADCASCTTP